MIVDTSAVVAILRNEPDADRYADALATASEPRISAGNYIEVGLVIDLNRDPVLSRRLDDLLSTASVEVEPVTQQQAEIARRAYRDFGKGSGHPAGLNFGDCFAYALARATGEPLLFKGDDFGHTDVQPVLT
ncbi:MAG: type II toxin-antitoxin system VapC family toxin [Candidatus Dormibacteria bacterium]